MATLDRRIAALEVTGGPTLLKVLVITFVEPDRRDREIVGIEARPPHWSRPVDREPGESVSAFIARLGSMAENRSRRSVPLAFSRYADDDADEHQPEGIAS